MGRPAVNGEVTVSVNPVTLVIAIGVALLVLDALVDRIAAGLMGLPPRRRR